MEDESKTALLDGLEGNGRLALAIKHERRSRPGRICILIGLFACITLAIVAAFTSHSRRRKSDLARLIDNGHVFSGPFSRFGEMEELEAKYRKLNMVTVWNNDRISSHMRHFLYSVAQNNETVDLLFINRRLAESDSCINFEDAGIDVVSKSNIKIICMGPQEWKERHVDFLCSKSGWSCSAAQRAQVFSQLGQTFYDARNYDLRPLQGYVYQDLFEHQRPLWSWVDSDMILGRMELFPLNIAAKLSVVSAQPGTTRNSFMQGQFCVFNLEDPTLSSIWKHMKELQTPEAFSNFLQSGKTSLGSEEHTWSTVYFGLREQDAGRLLDYANIAEFHGDDFWPYFLEESAFVISGRDMLMVDHFESREVIERLLSQSNNLVDDNVRNAGWTKGVDGSELMINDPTLSQEAALAIIRAPPEEKSSVKLETVYYDYNIKDEVWMQLNVPDRFFRGYWSKLRASFVHFKEHKDQYLFQRLEVDKRPRGFDRKLWKHHLTQKHEKEFGLPDFDLTDQYVLVYHKKGLYVFEKGVNREVDVFSRVYSSKP